LYCSTKKKRYPIDDWHKVTQHYGVTNWTLYPKTGKHWGTDWGVPVGTPIYAHTDGFLRDVKSEPAIKDLGNYCLFSFAEGEKVYTILHAHLSKINKYGEYKKGDVIAWTGNTGKSTAPHLHSEVWKGLVIDRNQIVQNTLDPLKFIV